MNGCVDSQRLAKSHETDNHGIHTERGLRPDLKWTPLLSPPGDAGRSANT